MNEQETELVKALLGAHISQLKRLVVREENLASPVPAGRWRWADIRPGGRKKTEEELARDRLQASVRSARLKVDLALARSALTALEAAGQ